ncbi:MAG: hypothetical protein A4E31_01257 [Methanomassiliicoccales archaeon PtaU1.Bin030]|nr:MAG: hypothetical protein A4E31_01257 [Methanomassiliicoccales archaeon PtaU1.Bin030]
MAIIAHKELGGKSLVMEQINVDKAKEIAKKKGLKPGRVKGTNGIQFTKGSNDRLEIIPWDEFEKTLKSRGLGVFESGGWMKIMKK